MLAGRIYLTLILLIAGRTVLASGKRRFNDVVVEIDRPVEETMDNRPTKKDFKDDPTSNDWEEWIEKFDGNEQLFKSDTYARMLTYLLADKDKDGEDDGKFRKNCQKLARKKLIMRKRKFRKLCKHFGPRVTAEVIGRMNKELSNDDRDRNHDKNYDYVKAFEIQKPVLASCFRKAFHHFLTNSNRYDVKSRFQHIACLRHLLEHPVKDFQVTWFTKFPQLLRYFRQVIGSPRFVKRTAAVARIILDRDLLAHWQKRNYLKWASAKIEEWKNSEIRDTEKKIRKVFQQSPKLFEICNLTKKGFGETPKLERNDCFMKMLANVLLLEKSMQEYGATLEDVSLGGKPVTLSLVYIVKGVLNDKSSPDYSRVYKNILKNSLRSEIYELRSANVWCANVLREMLENDISDRWINSEKMKECLNIFTEKISKLVETAIQLHGRKAIKFKNPLLWRKVETDLMKSIMESYNDSKLLMPAIRQGLARISSDIDYADFKWAHNFIRKWQSSTIPNMNERLEKIYRSTNKLRAEPLCDRIKNNYETSMTNCWYRYVTEMIIVQAELMKNSLSLQSMFLGDPFLMNLIYLIEKALEGYKLGLGSRKAFNFRRSNVQPIIEEKRNVDTRRQQRAQVFVTWPNEAKKPNDFIIDDKLRDQILNAHRNSAGNTIWIRPDGNDLAKHPEIIKSFAGMLNDPSFTRVFDRVKL